ncbi:MAG: FAD-dependent oxidoreductase [Armatimonadota bacterium]|nr:FAD-dependent oxidoreductase [Armatimonadota bacterium]MDR7532022.1 FAD-dependent oxidoreductase [Armatimonadota bacterium]MDR7535953.1 FAD-dependent oxidoreductase [Armatimonadota bacterium]
MTRSLWLDESYAARPALRGETRASVAIIGAGLTGVSTAYWLAERRVTAVVLDAEAIAAGATGRNGGFLLEGTSPDFTDLATRYGRQAARDLWAFTAENRRRLLDVCAREGLACEVEPGGSIALAASEQAAAILEGNAQALAEDGYPCQWLDRQAVGALLQGAPLARTVVAGLLNPRDVGINPARLTRGLAEVAARRGARIYERTPARALAGGGASWTVTTPEGTVRAEAVVLALNAYAALVDPAWQDVIRPIRGQVLATAPVSQRLFRHLWYAHGGVDYWRQLANGRVLLGGLRRLAASEEVGTDDRLHPRIQRALDGYLRDLGVPPVAVTHRWSGILGLSPDRLPLIGPVPGRPRLFMAGGYSGQGLAFAFLAGRMLAELLTTGTTTYPRLLYPERVWRGAAP